MGIADLLPPLENPPPTPNPDTDNPWLTTAEAAAHTKLSESMLEKARCNGSGPVYSKKGKAVRYLKSDVDAWMAVSKRKSTSDTKEAA
jgi:predicted DNA-binding transcriptional regulator AlpA